MRKLLGSLILSTLAAGSSVWAQEEVGGVTERPYEEVTRGVFESPITVSPRVGALGFKDSTQTYTSRVAEGITINWNVPKSMMDYGNFTFGLESGALFSHNGAVGSNFFGMNGVPGIPTSANTFLVPMNLVGNFKVTDSFVIAPFVGANAIYRSVSNSMLFGRASDTAGGSSTEFFPNAGLNLGLQAGRNVGFSLRTDVIPTPSTVMFTSTLGATFPLA